MKNLVSVSTAGIFFLVVLRIAIGWQFLYEGMWKYQTLSTVQPWTSEGYLKNAQGPLRDYFRDMTGDPDDLNWLDYGKVSQRWYGYRDRFATYYGLDEGQLAKLNVLLDGSAKEDTPAGEDPPVVVLTQPIESLPPVAEKFLKDHDRDWKDLLRFDREKKNLVLLQPLLPTEEEKLLSLVDVVMVKKDVYTRRQTAEEAEADAPLKDPDPVELEWFKAIEKLGKQSRELSFRHKLAGSLRGNPDQAGVLGELNDKNTYDYVMGTLSGEDEDGTRHSIRYGEIQEYRDLLREYDAMLDNTSMNFQSEHATMLARKVAQLRGRLVSPIKSLENSYKSAARDLLTPQQLAKGVLPPEPTPLHRSDMMVLYGLLALGFMLIIGLFTRFAALAGAVMVLSFYLVVPPWPGVPQPPGPEHSLIVNKNLIEVLALLAIAMLPSGTWFGVDGIFTTLFRRFRSKSAAVKSPPRTA